jgi:hypothetical protein
MVELSEVMPVVAFPAWAVFMAMVDFMLQVDFMVEADSTVEDIGNAPSCDSAPIEWMEEGTDAYEHRSEELIFVNDER